MASKEAIEYGENTVCKKSCKTCVMSVTGMKCDSYRFAIDAFDAGYSQAEKDMPKQFAAKLLEELGEELDKDNYLLVKTVIENLGVDFYNDK